MSTSLSRFFVCLGAGILSGTLALPASAQALPEGAALCLHRVDVPMSEAYREPQRTNLEGKLIAALREASFVVADPAAVDALVDRVLEESGGYIDTATGDRDEARLRAYRTAVGRALQSELGCSALVRASVVPLRAPLANGVVSWDGTTQSVSSEGRRALHIFRGIQERGWVTALSLWLQVFDFDGNRIAFRSAGIETPVQLAVVEDKDLLPEDRWLTDEIRLDSAIRSALGPQGESLRLHGTP